MPDSLNNRGLAEDPHLGTTLPSFANDLRDTEFPVLFQGVSWDDFEAMLRIRGDRRFRITYDRGSMEVVFPSRREVLSGIAWDDYETMLRIVGDRPIRLTYRLGEMEIRMPSQEHELASQRLGQLVPILAEELEVDYLPLGTTTWRRPGAERGLEADQCYYIRNHDAVFGKKLIDLEVDPPPDLAVEVDITTSVLDRLDIYASLGIAEIWRHDGKDVTFFFLDAGRYATRESSDCFPGLVAKDVAQLLSLGSTMTARNWTNAVRLWVRDVLIRQRQEQRPDGHE